MSTPTAADILRENLRAALVADGVPEDEVDAVTDELVARAREKGRQIRERTGE